MDPGNQRDKTLSTRQKALAINLDDHIYGTIAEIGAGQEVARQFFQAGAAAGTVAKTMSAYDMQVSDEIYGRVGRYVSRDRMEQMLAKEYPLLIERLTSVRPPDTCYFSYAATVSAKSFKENRECHGWIGLKLQLSPDVDASNIFLHVRMLDNENVLQSEALGVLGVNLIHAAYNYADRPDWIVEALSDSLGSDRIEIDFIEFSGEGFKEVDNRLMNLHLIRAWQSRAVLFSPSGQSVVPHDELYKKSALLLRSSFKPPTLSTQDMAKAGLDQFLELSSESSRDNTITIAEISISELMTDDRIDDVEFLARVDLATALGYHVLLTDYVRLFSLRSWMRRYTSSPIAIIIKASDFNYLFNDSYYHNIEGGILEAMGKLFADNTRVLVYPSPDEQGKMVELSNVPVPEHHRLLLKYLIKNSKLIASDRYVADYVCTTSKDVLAKIRKGEDWKKDVPAVIAEQILARNLFIED